MPFHPLSDPTDLSGRPLVGLTRLVSHPLCRQWKGIRHPWNHLPESASSCQCLQARTSSKLQKRTGGNLWAKTLLSSKSWSYLIATASHWAHKSIPKPVCNSWPIYDFYIGKSLHCPKIHYQLAGVMLLRMVPANSLCSTLICVLICVFIYARNSKRCTSALGTCTWCSQSYFFYWCYQETYPINKLTILKMFSRNCVLNTF